MLETLDHTIRIGSTPTFLYFDLYLYSAYTAHYVYTLVLYVYVYIYCITPDCICQPNETIFPYQTIVSIVVQ